MARETIAGLKAELAEQENKYQELVHFIEKVTNEAEALDPCEEGEQLIKRLRVKSGLQEDTIPYYLHLKVEVPKSLDNKITNEGVDEDDMYLEICGNEVKITGVPDYYED